MIQIGNQLNIAEQTKIPFAATFFYETAAAWWYTRVGSKSIPATWNDFESALLQ